MRTSPPCGRWIIPFVAVLLLSFSACESRGVGDPCIPEALPRGGVVANELYVESGSAQCRTRTCVAFNFGGNPACVYDEDLTCPDECDGDCRTREDVLLHVHCSCRCRGGSETADLPTCACGEGFHCVDRLDVVSGAPVDGYCVHNDADPHFCDATHPCGDNAECVASRCRPR